MKDAIEFYEQQQKHSWWYWVLLTGLNLWTIYGCIRQVAYGQPFGNNPASDMTLIIITVSILLITSVLLSLKLITLINKDGIFVRFHPIQLKRKYFSWDEIEQAYIRKYNAVLEYGGWGYRWALRNKAYNVSGNIGLQLVLKNGKKILIGTNNPEELTEVVRKLGKLS